MDIPNQRESVTGFTENIKKVDNFLKKLMQNYHKQGILIHCLNELYKIIMTVGKNKATI